MKYLRKIGMAGIVLAVLLAGCAAGSPTSPSPDATGVVITPRPSATPAMIDFTVEDLQGNAVSLADLRGQVVLVNFWATWCPPCKEEMPVLEAYYQAHQGEGFVVVAVNVTEDTAVARTYIEETGYTFPVWSDPPGKQLATLNIRGLPASLFLNREGRLVQFWSGPLTEDKLDELVQPLLVE